MATQIAFIPVLVMGLILAFLEIMFVHKDESGMGWMKHAIHAIPTMLIFIFISMNIDYVCSLFNFTPTIYITIGIRVVVGIIAAIKISAAAAVAGRVGEKLPHTLIIAVLVMAAPFIWEMALCAIPFVKALPYAGCPA